MRISLYLFPFLLFFASCAGVPEIIAHRGASYNAPENTMAAIELAWEEKADSVEFDVYYTLDRKVILHHDHTTRRTTGIDHSIEQTHSDELRKLDVGKWKDARFEGEKMPFMSEVLAEIPRGSRVFIDVKSGPAIVELLKEDIENSPLRPSQVVIIGFAYNTMVEAKRAMPDYEVYWLISTKYDENDHPLSYDPIMLELVEEGGLDGLNVHFRGVTPEFMKHVRAKKQPLYVWTVNDPKEAVRLAGFGVDGITTDKPEEIRDAIKEAYPWRYFLRRILP